MNKYVNRSASWPLEIQTWNPENVFNQQDVALVQAKG